MTQSPYAAERVATEPARPEGSGPVSVLFPEPLDLAELDNLLEPNFFSDLNLDQVVHEVVMGRDGYNLLPFFYRPLTSIDEIVFRHQVFTDLQVPQIHAALDAFALGMRETHRLQAVAAKMRIPMQQQAWVSRAMRAYLDAVVGLGEALNTTPPTSRGLSEFARYLDLYVGSTQFTTLSADLSGAEKLIADVRYCVEIRGAQVRVTRFEGEEDLSREILETFERFRTRPVDTVRTQAKNVPDMDHVESRILDRVALLFPEPFLALAALHERHQDYADPTVARFEREIEFYRAVESYLGPLAQAGLPTCLPAVSSTKHVRVRDTYDLALATQLVANNGSVVVNDFFLEGPERIFVVTGPNQGGKTTFARTFGQLHYLAILGCPVAGSEVTLHLFDQMFTHFEREEDITNLRGKLQDDLVRLRTILDAATSDSIVILNEIFTSTSLEDAVLLGRKVVERLSRLGALGVCVTFLDELTTIDESTVSMVSGVTPSDVSVRTFKIERRPADGRSYAAAIAEKYGLGYENLKAVLQR